MDKKTRRLVFAALMTALTLVFLYFACLIPVGLIGFVALSSIFCIAAVIESGRVYGVGVYVASTLLGFLLMPSKTGAILFAAFFGIYPVLKSLFEQPRRRSLEWIFKIVSFNALFTVVWLLIGKLIFSDKILSYPVAIIYLGCNVVFVLYDLGLSKLIVYYINRISNKLKR